MGHHAKRQTFSVNKTEARPALIDLSLLVQQHFGKPRIFMKREVPVPKIEIFFRRKRLEPDFGIPVTLGQGMQSLYLSRGKRGIQRDP